MDAYCPECGTKLVRTSYLYRGPWKIVSYAFKPIKKRKGK
jgi:hypothetical protein